MVYFISYDLKQPGRDYTGVFDSIKAASTGAWAHIMDSAWIIRSDYLSANAVFERIRPHLDADDTCIVIEVTKNAQGKLENGIWDYINSAIFV